MRTLNLFRADAQPAIRATAHPVFRANADPCLELMHALKFRANEHPPNILDLGTALILDVMPNLI